MDRLARMVEEVRVEHGRNPILFGVEHRPLGVQEVQAYWVALQHAPYHLERHAPCQLEGESGAQALQLVDQAVAKEAVHVYGQHSGQQHYEMLYVSPQSWQPLLGVMGNNSPNHSG